MPWVRVKCDALIDAARLLASALPLGYAARADSIDCVHDPVVFAAMIDRCLAYGANVGVV
jgi:hypothetical protein